jgi:DNA-binding HxlR family transcriptional regulator/putative sterol carrier protein
VSRRTYNQYCATARTLDIVGERWTLLLIRELLTGPARFGDLLANLRGIGPGLLAARLKYLQEEGLVEQITLPPPANTPVYALTEAGAELRPAVLELARWGLRWALGDRHEDEVFRPGWAVLGMQASFHAEAARDVRAVYEFRVDSEVWYAHIDRGTIEVAHGPAQRPDAVIETTADTFLELAAGRVSLTGATRAGVASVSGDREVVRKLPAIFGWPSGSRRSRGSRAGAAVV